MKRRWVSRVLIGTLVASALAVGPSAGAAGTCGPAEHPGGEWPSYGGNLSNTRTQAAESTITPGTVTSLTPAWIFNTAIGGDPADVFTGTPVVAGGCVFVGAGSIYALNADTGDLVWRAVVPGGVGTGSTLAVDGGRVFAHGTTDGHPSVTGLDQATGAILWMTVLSEQPNANAGLGASPVAFDGLVLSGIQGGLEFTEEARQTTNGSVSLLDAATGQVLRREFIIPEEDFAQGYTGGNVWTTAVVDRATGYAYLGTAATYNADKEHPRTNAIVKLDVDRSRATFGQIVDSYKGTPDYYFHFQEELPCTRLVPGSNTVEGLTGPCAVQDLDFGASPNLFVDAQGRTIVGEVQKSGIYHAVDTATMEPVWTTLVAAPHGAGTLSSTAYDGTAIYGGGSYYQSHLYALEPGSGDYRWFSVAPDTVRASPVSVANGVVFSANTDGLLTAHDARTGALLLARPVPVDSATAASGLGTGVAIARNTVYVNGGGALVAYRVDPAVPDLTPVVSGIPTPPSISRQGQPPV